MTTFNSLHEAAESLGFQAYHFVEAFTADFAHKVTDYSNIASAYAVCFPDGCVAYNCGDHWTAVGGA